jgi:hypothetical protein
MAVAAKAAVKATLIVELTALSFITFFFIAFLLVRLSYSFSLPFYPVRKPQHLCWGWWKYLQKQEHQLLIEDGIKALPFQTEFTDYGKLPI